jgi:BirA family biotin operon repressor/biotin-[acetyl-CoA-carboxylase] ligase
MADLVKIININELYSGTGNSTYYANAMIVRELDRNIRKYRECGSTNAEMARLLEEEHLAEGTVLTAEYQSAGKGQQGNTWLSERGKNLLFSILLRPEFLPAAEAFHLSRIASLSLVDVLDKQGVGALIKWPNDILAGTSKISGILIENSIIADRISHSVIGIGLNVNQEAFDQDNPSPTSLLIEKGCQFDMNLLLSDFHTALEGWYRVLFAGKKEVIEKAYTERLFRMGIPAEYSDGREVFKGTICGVLAGGELELRLENGEIRRFGFKEIEYL